MFAVLVRDKVAGFQADLALAAKIAAHVPGARVAVRGLFGGLTVFDC